jgi:hypothetical protein
MKEQKTFNHNTWILKEPAFTYQMAAVKPNEINNVEKHFKIVLP